MNKVTIAVVLDGMDLTDAQWAVLEPTFRPRRRPDGRGRPWTDPRAVLNGVLWVLRTARPGTICRAAIRRTKRVIVAFKRGSAPGASNALLQRLAEDLRDRGKIDLVEAFIDATFGSAKKGALPSALLAAAKAPRSWRSATAMVFLSPCTWPALRRMKPHLVPATLAARFLRHLPTRLIGDRGYDSDPLDRICATRTASR